MNNLNEAKPLVLYIDDNRGNHEIIARRFHKKGISCVSAYNGDRGIKIAKEVKLSLILLDIYMSSMNGFEVLKRLHNEDLQIPPIWAVTADHSLRKECLVSGFDGFICKPILGSDIDSIATRLMSQSQYDPH